MRQVRKFKKYDLGSLTVSCPDGDPCTVNALFTCCGYVEIGADSVSATLSGGGLQNPLNNGAQVNPFSGWWEIEMGPVPLSSNTPIVCQLEIDSLFGSILLDQVQFMSVTVVPSGAPECDCATGGGFFRRLSFALGRAFRHLLRFFGLYGGRRRPAPPPPRPG
jgi:hypothetical protein